MREPAAYFVIKDYGKSTSTTKMKHLYVRFIMNVVHHSISKAKFGVNNKQNGKTRTTSANKNLVSLFTVTIHKRKMAHKFNEPLTVS